MLLIKNVAYQEKPLFIFGIGRVKQIVGELAIERTGACCRVT